MRFATASSTPPDVLPAAVSLASTKWLFNPVAAHLLRTFVEKEGERRVELEGERREGGRGAVFFCT